MGDGIEGRKKLAGEMVQSEEKPMKRNIPEESRMVHRTFFFEKKHKFTSTKQIEDTEECKKVEKINDQRKELCEEIEAEVLEKYGVEERSMGAKIIANRGFVFTKNSGNA